MDGDYWTIRKLERIEAYLPLFTREMERKGLRALYVDAFAGDGTVYFKEPEPTSQVMLLPTEFVASVPGSARRALSVDPPFDRYLLNDKKKANCKKLKKMRDACSVADRAFVHHRDANEFVLDVCKRKDWNATRAVFLLDPFGMQLSWKTLKAIAKTKAADVWYLFPISAVVRLLARNGIENEARQQTLQRVLGIRNIDGVFYRKFFRKGILADFAWTARTIDMGNLVRLMVKRFRALFPFVPWPKLVDNRAGSTMFLLFFASAIPEERETNEFMKILMGYPFNAPLPRSI